MNSIVPFGDLYSQYENLKEEIDYAIENVIKTSAFVRGYHVETFEESFANIMQRAFCVSCGNGTDALYIALKAMGIKPGDEVIVPAHSWISTSEVVTQAGGRVVFCDTDSSTYTLDVASLKSKITSKTVGVIPVHLFGQSAAMPSIMEVCDSNHLWVVEDCAQAHLATINGQQIGTFGNAATFSFYPGKNLGAMGDAGAIITSDSSLAERMAMYARHGGLKKGEHYVEGINSRLDGLQAAVLNVKLRYLSGWTDQRQKIAKQYLSHLSDIEGLELPTIRAGCEHVWHLFVIQHDDRDRLKEYLSSVGISTAINYPIALPFVPAYKYLNHRSTDFPNAYHNQSRILSLPLYPEMSQDKINYVIEKLHDFSN